jgi:hypothetical protein
MYKIFLIILILFDITGKCASSGQCMPYAITLSQKLAAVGIHGRFVYYIWINLHPLQHRPYVGAHVYLLYWDKGKLWVVDSNDKNPRLVPPSWTDRQIDTFDTHGPWKGLWIIPAGPWIGPGPSYF